MPMDDARVVDEVVDTAGHQLSYPGGAGRQEIVAGALLHEQRIDEETPPNAEQRGKPLSMELEELLDGNGVGR